MALQKQNAPEAPIRAPLEREAFDLARPGTTGINVP